MRRPADDDLLALVAETNDLRRVVGQALWHLRTLLLLARDRPERFTGAVRLWATAGATAFSRMEARLTRAGPEGRDAHLRPWTAALLEDLARDLREGDRLLVAFARTLDARLGEIGRLLREDPTPRRTFDVPLARDLAVALGAVAREPARGVPAAVARAATLVRGGVPVA